jgi:hypothetical protein
MPRWAKARDKNDLEIYRALDEAYCAPIRGNDCDIYARHRNGHGMLLEVKTTKGRMRPIQRELAMLFGDRYVVVRDVESALIACGISP